MLHSVLNVGNCWWEMLQLKCVPLFQLGKENLGIVDMRQAPSTIRVKLCMTILGGSKITADGDCSHEIKRRLLLGRKVMTNLDSILKSRDITLPTKVYLVKVMVFPVVTYGCESWTVKKTEG